MKLPGDRLLEHTAARYLFAVAAVAAAALLLSLGPEPTVWGHRVMSSGPYAWLDALVPVLDALRVPARFASVVYLALTLIAAIGVASLLSIT